MAASSIVFKSVRAGSTTDCFNQLHSLLQDELKLKKSQFISMSIHDSKVKHGDLEAVVFYRETAEGAEENLIKGSLQF
jgi:hypothetical protein